MKGQTMDRHDTGGLPFPDEAARLSMTCRALAEALAEAEEAVARLDREYMGEKRYMAQYRGEIDPHEMFQNELALRRIDSSGAFAVKHRDRLRRLLDAPYFARVDFRPEEREAAAVCYIGPFAFRHENELLICDWRSPVASLFYDCETGPAWYDAPIGRVRGELVRKRQFSIKGGVLEFALETSSRVGDDVLQRELSRTADEKMKSIIATIQKEQNRLIRNERAGTLLIQGVAGSGKTSIALHRVAYQLYRYKGSLSAENVAILSPNRVFGDYISNVLPELGEEPILQSGFQEVAALQLDGVIGFLPEGGLPEEGDPQALARARFKATAAFLGQLEEYLARLAETVFQPRDCAIGPFRGEAGWLRERYAAYGKHPVKRRLAMMAEDLRGRFAGGNYLDDPLPSAKRILKELTAMLTDKNALTLYKAFYRWLGRPELFRMPAKGTLEWADVYPFLYLYSSFEGLRVSRSIRHLVIDEMQDHTPVQYAVINRLFPCQKTLLGDFGQSVDPSLSHTLDDLRALYGDAELVELNRSYRSTCEIMAFACAVRPVAGLEPVARHGPPPAVVPCRDGQEALEQLEEAVAAFPGGGASLGVITKTDREARALFERLSGRFDVHLISPESTRYEGGISIASVRMSKGLEFDEVLIPGADSRSYAAEYDRNLLYVACTRAMHRLTLLHAGEPSRFLPPTAST